MTASQARYGKPTHTREFQWPSAEEMVTRRPGLVPSRDAPVPWHRLQDVPPKSTSLVSTAPAVRPGAVW
jgi:hypothetical protein